jgi:mitochondrial inner membrane protease subunit 1
MLSNPHRRGALRAVGTFVAAFVSAYHGIASLKRISGSSMQPTLNAQGDWVFVNNFAWSFRRGDVVIATSNAGELVCKRITATAGDVVETTVAETALSDSMVVTVVRPVVVPDGHVWLEGDNPSSSHDSRAYGPVPVRSVHGRVVARVWPIARIGFIGPRA